MTNILRLPQVAQDFDTTANADWIGSWFFGGPGSASAIRDPNHSRGTFSSIAVGQDAKVGTYRVVLTDVSGPTKRFAVTDLDEQALGQGVVGAPLTVAGLTFTLSTSGGDFVLGDGFTLSVLAAPIDLSGIRFDLGVRRSRSSALSPYRATVDLQASTLGTDPALVAGTTSGILSIAVPQDAMQALAPGGYDYDVIASAEGHTKRVAAGALRHDYGVTALSAA